MARRAKSAAGEPGPTGTSDAALKSGTRLGRPPATDSAETRARILTAARGLFAAKGYEATSNRAIAEESGVTTGAIYHYFDRKLDIFAAVYEDTQRTVYRQFESAARGSETFAERLRLVLDTAHRLNNDDPSLAQFLGSCRVDASRDPELDAALEDVGGSRRARFFGEMIELGVRTGEVDPGHAPMLAAVVETVTVGLVDAVSNDRERHRRAVDGVLALIEGKLIRPVPET